MDLDSESLYIVCTISSPGEIGQVELNLIPTFIQSHGHCTNEWLDSCCTLIVGSSESSSYALVIQYLHFEGEIFLQVLDDHDEERQLDGERLLGVKWGVDVVCRNIGAHDLEDRRLNIRICNPLDMSISN